jgi:hypothetical protein
VLTGCGRGQVQEYRVAKEPPQSQPTAFPPGHPDVSPGAMPANAGIAPVAMPGVQYKKPADWQERPAGQMRAASFQATGKNGKTADVSVIPLPGLAGSDLDNVNRWRGQVGLTGVSAEELDKLAQPVDIAGQPAKLYEQTGTAQGAPDKTTILAAITRRGGVAWFFKMTGNEAVVAEQKPAFIEFLKSVSFPEATTQAQLPPGHPSMDAGGMLAQPLTATESSQPKPNWEVPSGWKEIPGGQFLVAKFVPSNAPNGEAAINVSMSPGDGGGLLANLNRWRGQLGLAPTTEANLSAETQSLDLAAGKATLADISGKDARTGKDARLLAVVVPQSGHTWFYKLMGDAKVVDGEKAAFLKFVQTAKY